MRHTRDLLSELAQNLRWIWNGEFESLFRELDKDLWVSVNHNPTAFLLEVEESRLEEKAKDPHYRVRLERALSSLRAYVEGEKHWARASAPGLSARPVAYFSAEFGLHESLPIYSGGLGMLAGDHIKSSSDLGVPLWGVTILYREGYFLQHVQQDGTQEEVYTELDLDRVALVRVLDKNGQPLSVQIPADHGVITIDLWQTKVGRANMLVLDGHAESLFADRHALTRRLYGGDLRTRLLQELILGVGGYRALRAIGVRPGVIHMNEGHSAFVGLQAVAETMEEEGLTFDQAAERVREKTIFTTHTPVAAGHDRFPPDLIEEHLSPLRNQLHLSREQFLGLGRVNPNDQGEAFCMTVLALKLSVRANAVSALHGHTSRSMWQSLWPGKPTSRVPIGHVTNGVHVPSWIAPQMAQFFNRSLGADWLTRLCHARTWEGIYSIDPFEIWDVKCALRQNLLAFVKRRLQVRQYRLGLGPIPFSLNPEALTIGFARRFVEYKRPTLFFKDMERILRLLSDTARPIQFVYAGKAHPNDNIGKGLIRELFQITQDPKFFGRVVFLENYDMNMARHLVQGCDLWLNTPRRPLEACGTSGQKAIFNGTLNLSTLDGWWAEAYDKRNGYAFGDGLTHTDPAKQDARDIKDLLDVLEFKVIPDFFERSPEGVPTKWIQRIIHALVTLGARYNSDRMVMDYVRNCYLPTVGSITSDFPVET